MEAINACLVELMMPPKSKHETLVRVPAELYLLDSVDDPYKLRYGNVVASVIETTAWECIVVFFSWRLTFDRFSHDYGVRQYPALAANGVGYESKFQLCMFLHF